MRSDSDMTGARSGVDDALVALPQLVDDNPAQIVSMQSLGLRLAYASLGILLAELQSECAGPSKRCHIIALADDASAPGLRTLPMLQWHRPGFPGESMLGCRSEVS
jgi:hypothetical protein